jgi:polar amino acid transport system substrate-binding protein
VTIAIENAYLPFNYISLETREPGGWDYDAWDAICDLINCNAVYVEAAWDGMIVAVSEGLYDAAADGITITDERAEIVDFSDGYIAIEQRMLVRDDEERFTEPEEFAADESLLMGSQPGTTNFATAVEQIFGGDDTTPRLLAFETFGIAVEALLSGEIDAVLMDETAGLGYVGVNADQLKVVGRSLSSDQLGFIFPLGSDLVDPVNQALVELEANGTLAALAVKYFTDQFVLTYDEICQGAYKGDEC